MWIEDPFSDDVDLEDAREPANALPLLQQWYLKQCDGEWEHRCGVKIESCDNPGWWVKIDLVGTALEGKRFEPIKRNVSQDGLAQGYRWMSCEIIESVWNGAGDARRLNHILLEFLNWAADVDPGWPGKPKRSK
jgi:hypothetical protein